jgi:hypothetical protein
MRTRASTHAPCRRGGQWLDLMKKGVKEGAGSQIGGGGQGREGGGWEEDGEQRGLQLEEGKQAG